MAAGARLLRARDDEIGWDVLADPEGNEFCVFAPPADPSVLTVRAEPSPAVGKFDGVGGGLLRWGERCARPDDAHKDHQLA